MKLDVLISTLIAVGIFTDCSTPQPERMSGEKEKHRMESFYLPDAEASQVVSVTNAGPAAASVLVQTHRAAVKETGPEERLGYFGEVYASSPAFFAVHREEPTQIRFWNLQPDDLHTFMLADSHLNVLMNVAVPAVQETSYMWFPVICNW